MVPSGEVLKKEGGARNINWPEAERTNLYFNSYSK